MIFAWPYQNACKKLFYTMQWILIAIIAVFLRRHIELNLVLDRYYIYSIEASCLFVAVDVHKIREMMLMIGSRKYGKLCYMCT